MKNLLYLFLGVGMIFTWSCSDGEALPDQEPPMAMTCADDYAEYTYNGTSFTTTFTAGGGEIVNPDGDNCGIGAVLDENNNLLTMRIFGEAQQINIHVEVTTLNEPVKFQFLEYTNGDVVSTFQDLPLDAQNFVQIEAMDTSAKTINGTFGFQVENANGDMVTVTGGSFNCAYNSF